MESAPAITRLAESSLRAHAPAAPRRRAHITFLLLPLIICGHALAPRDAGAQPSPAAAPPIEREIRGGELHSFRLLLNPGQFVRAVFDQRGVDIVLTLAGPDGAELLRVDSPNGEWGPEPLFFEVGAGGHYTIQARARRPFAGPGR